jgi:hypothetical protein
VKARIALRCCVDFDVFEARGVKLGKKGTKFTTGPITFEVEEDADDSGFEDLKHDISLRTHDDVHRIKKMTFRVNNGEIPSRCVGATTISNGKDTTYYPGYHLATLPDEVDVVATMYRDLENPKTVIVPVEITTRMDLAPAE